MLRDAKFVPITLADLNPKKKSLAKKSAKKVSQPKTKRKRAPKVKDVLEDFSYAQLEGEQMEMEVVRPTVVKELGEVAQPPSRRSSRLGRTKKIEKPTMKRLLVIISSDEVCASSPPHKKSKETASYDPALLMMTLI